MFVIPFATCTELRTNGIPKVVIPCSLVIPCRNLFAANISSPGANLFAVANCYARFQEIFGEPLRQILCSPRTQFAANPVRGERSLEVDLFLPANEFSGEPFASSRRSTGELGRTRANFAELRRTFGVLRRTFAGVRRSVGVGEPMANSRGVRASSLE